MFQKFIQEIKIKKHIFAYLFLMVLFSLMYAFAFSMIYTLCSMSNSILPLLIGNYILYIAAAFVMTRIHYSMMMIIEQKEKEIKTFSLLKKVVLIYTIFYLLLSVAEFVLQAYSNMIVSIFVVVIQVLAVVYMPLQIYISKYLYSEESILNSFKKAFQAIKSNYLDVFYLGIVIVILTIALKYFIAQDFLFLSELGNFVLFYNPYLGIYDLFDISMIQVIVVFIIGCIIMACYVIYSMYLMWKEGSR